MTVRSTVRASSLVACVALLAVVFVLPEQGPQASAADKPAAGPSHQVIACYFHRTVRCPTCRRISAYIEESVNTGFASQVKDGSVKMVMIDFQDARNQKYTEAYQIAGPTLVLMDVHSGKVTSWKPAPKVWSLVGNKDEFFRYVQGELQSYLEVQRTVAR
ncbi:MAG: nitrophenyl compound nitroreductase subunit ArsF family protein [Thermoguttaceae bacterium]